MSTPVSDSGYQIHRPNCDVSTKINARQRVVVRKLQNTKHQLKLMLDEGERQVTTDTKDTLQAELCLKKKLILNKHEFAKTSIKKRGYSDHYGIII